MRIVFATNNLHKLTEIRNALSSSGIGSIEIVGLHEIGINEIIPETQHSLKGNAIQKARYIFDKYSVRCFADDTGLEVKSLGNRPGVHSARYAGEDCSFDDNINKLLKEMSDVENREARFCTVIAYMYNGNLQTFEGIIEGEIMKDRHGKSGFGYDPVFRPAGFDKTFAEMSLDEKNAISHRALALQKLLKFLSKGI
jgi:XTP/dITP diphosphohydrolase